MRVFEIEKDGLPNMDDPAMTGRVAFIFDGSIVSGWPLIRAGYGPDVWEADADVGRHKKFGGVKKYIVFDVPVWKL